MVFKCLIVMNLVIAMSARKNRRIVMRLIVLGEYCYVAMMLICVHCYRKGPFYLENKSLPVFKWNTHTYKVPEIVNTLLNTSKNVCLGTPTSVEHNCTFLVEQTKLKCTANLRADDSGSWEYGV